MEKRRERTVLEAEELKAYSQSALKQADSLDVRKKHSVVSLLNSEFVLRHSFVIRH